MFTYIISCYELTGFKFLEPLEVFDHKTKRPFKYLNTYTIKEQHTSLMTL